MNVEAVATFCREAGSAYSLRRARLAAAALVRKVRPDDPSRRARRGWRANGCGARHGDRPLSLHLGGLVVHHAERTQLIEDEIDHNRTGTRSMQVRDQVIQAPDRIQSGDHLPGKIHVHVRERGPGQP